MHKGPLMVPRVEARLDHIDDAIQKFGLLSAAAPTAMSDRTLLAAQRSRGSSKSSSKHRARSRLGCVKPAVAPEMGWKGIASIGNILRHAYQKADFEIVWPIYENDLRPLEAAVARIRVHLFQSEGETT